MKLASPTISIVIATYNRKSDLKDCLDSLMKQTYRSFEVIVVDDGSTDGTNDRVIHYPVKYIKTKHGGVVKAENIGVRNARGEIIAFIDDDCIASEDWLENLVKSYGRGIGAVGGRILYPDLQERTAVEVANIRGGNMSFLKRIFDEIGMFDENYKVDGFKFETDYCLRLLKKGYKLVYEPKAVVLHRSSPRGIGGLKRRSSLQRYFHSRNYMYFYLKNYLTIIRIPRFMVLELRRFLAYIFDSLIKREINTFLGYYAGVVTFLSRPKKLRASEIQL